MSTPSNPKGSGDEVKRIADQERDEILSQIDEWLELPVIVLGFIWLVLLVVELIWGLNPFLNALVYFIWGVFIFDFLLRFVLAPRKSTYLRKNWLTALSLFIPALRIGRIARLVRITRALRAARGLRLVSMVSSINRGMRALRRTMQRRGFGYVMLLTLIVVLVGAAGMYAFETSPDGEQAGFATYGEALWWTAMIMTTLGSEAWPSTAEGRLLTLLLSLYAFAIFGYVTATVASFFIGRDVEVAGEAEQIAVTGEEGQSAAVELREELRALRGEIAALRQELDNRDRRQE